MIPLMAENAGRKQPGRGLGRPFPKGQSGNPRGKPSGARHAITVMAEKLMHDDLAEIVRAVITKAKNGDMIAARLVLDRIAPLRRGRPISLTIPEIAKPDDIVAALGAVTSSMASGDITPEEASAVASVLETNRKAMEFQELEMRLAALEAQAANPK